MNKIINKKERVCDCCGEMFFPLKNGALRDHCSKCVNLSKDFKMENLENINKKFKNLVLNESIIIANLTTIINTDKPIIKLIATKVKGGWIYSYINLKTTNIDQAVFVPE